MQIRKCHVYVLGNHHGPGAPHVSLHTLSPWRTFPTLSTRHCLESSNVSPCGHPWLPGLGLTQGQQWSVVAFLDHPRGQQQSLFHPPRVWMCQLMHQELQVQQGWCALHRSLQMWRGLCQQRGNMKVHYDLCDVGPYLVDWFIGQCPDLKHKINVSNVPVKVLVEISVNSFVRIQLLSNVDLKLALVMISMCCSLVFVMFMIM